MLYCKMSASISAHHRQALTPPQVRGAYGFNQVVFGSYAGDGGSGPTSGYRQTIAIVDPYDDPTALNDLNVFSSQFGLPQFNVSGGPTFTKVGQTGGTVPATDPLSGEPLEQRQGQTTWEEEESLDIEWAHAIAPQANILLVEADDPSSLETVAVPYAASCAGVVVVSMSFSGEEFPGEIAYDTYFTTPTGHANVTFISGTGGNARTGPGYDTSHGYPAYSPNVVAVGEQICRPSDRCTAKPGGKGAEEESAVLRASPVTKMGWSPRARRCEPTQMFL